MFDKYTTQPTTENKQNFYETESAVFGSSLHQNWLLNSFFSTLASDSHLQK